ncbi:hypothetical protein GCM10007385_27620 [Tateyamaria omphalii]|nr:hypothetical protein GCM10007385_27620 [Tateyamaria omphalii]
MHTHYRDILDRVSDPVLWFDEAAVPRFEPFSPKLTANIYAQEAVLVRIECQGCRTEFDVAFTSPAASKPIEPDDTRYRKYPLLQDYISSRKLHYGDPPNIRCCAAGASMNSIPKTVLEYWVKPYALGEGLGCSWPNRLDLENPKHVERARKGDLILAPGSMQFRRNPAFEGIDLTPEWAS